ncbi:MAG TPA: TonB-dependent receptor [Gemmatimonadales bacterium]|nr:TonB-dependent receptor [Gemmatimonadales bacterium]
MTRPLALAAVALVGGATLAHAQSAGKIEGRVRDQAGAPIANAQVFIVGTAFNATTNPQGYYFLNNVPAGAVVMRAAFVGYRPVQVEGLKVLAGQTITQDFALEKTVVQLEEVQVVTTTQPLVPRDEVATKQRIDGEMTAKLPVDRINQVLALQPGVVASASGNTLSIRGGRSDENATYVDGVPVAPGARSTYSISGAGSRLDVSTNGLEEASVTTGASSAEFGNAQSGVINITTRTGSATGYNGSLGFESDEPFGKNHSFGYNKLEASFGGPLPLLKGLTFYVGGDAEGLKSGSQGTGAQNGSTAILGGWGAQNYPLFVGAGTDTTVSFTDSKGVTSTADIIAFAQYRGDCSLVESSTNTRIASNYGQSCQGIRTPNTSSSSYRLNGKLNYSYGTGSKIALSLLTNQNQGRIFSYSNMWNPDNQFGQRAWSRAAILNWTQNLSKSAERALALDTYFSYQLDRYIQAPFNPGDAPGTGTLGMYLKPYKFRWDFDKFPLDTTLVNNFIVNNAPELSPLRFNRDLASQATVLANPYGERSNDYNFFGFTTSGGPDAARYQLMRENRTIGKANLDWQADRYNRVRLGGEFTKYHIENLSESILSQAFADAYIENPLRWAGFIEDRLDLGDLVLVGGLRYDFYDSRSSHPVFVCTAARDLDDSPTADGHCGPLAIGDTTLTTRISTNPDFDPANPLATYAPNQSHKYLSPHVQVSFPVTDRTNFRLSYAHQVQAPDFSLIYGGKNTDLSTTNTNSSFGADLDFGKTITFEFGIRHAFSDDMVLDLAAYNKDNLANPTVRLIRLYDPAKFQENDFRYLTNLDFGNTRGIDVRLDRRFGNIFNGTISYSFQQAKNTGSDPFTYNAFGARIINAISGANQPPPQAIVPTNQSRPHNLAGAFSATFPGDWKEGTALGTVLQDFGVYATFRYASGTAYTLCDPDPTQSNEQVLAGQVCSKGNYVGGLNAARLPAYKDLSMRFTKGFQVGGLNLSAYLDARNILNLKNVVTQFVTTNDITNGLEQRRFFEADSISLAEQASAAGVYDAQTGAVDLTFDGAGANGCTAFTDPNGSNNIRGVQDCVYLVRAEQRFGDGDGVFTQDEQRKAFMSAYNVQRGTNAFYAPGRQMRLGLQVNF